MGEEVIKVASMDAVRKNSDIVESLSGEKTVILGEDKTRCYWNDTEFTEGNTVCDGGVPYRCHMGLWVKQNVEC